MVDRTRCHWVKESSDILKKYHDEEYCVPNFDDDYLFEGSAHLILLMRELEFPRVNFRVREGTHQQEYWRTALPEVLTFVSIGFAGN